MYNILCVDDVSSNLLVIESIFEEFKKPYKLFLASSGYEALDILLKEQIDVILLDVMMPQLDGFETAKLIKSNKKTSSIPIIFLTAKKDDETITKAFKYGVDYLSKPYNDFELFTRIEVQLKLIQMQKELQEQVKFTQSVLDSQKSIIFIQSDNGIVSANKSFFDFFNVSNAEEFNQINNSIADLFMEYENYFALKVLNDGQSWTRELSKKSEDDDYNILIMDMKTFEPKAFKIDVNNIDDTDYFVVTLTDITKITSKTKAFEVKATYDALTNIYNRSKFNEIIQQQYEIFKTQKFDLSFAIFDIDFFKKVNDTYGHLIGDETLITFSHTINDHTRDGDFFARWGGEEFVLLMPDTSLSKAQEIANYLREIISKTHFKQIEHITCSVGVTQFKENDTIDDVLIRADDALYEAKEGGRNQVCTK